MVVERKDGGATNYAFLTWRLHSKRRSYFFRVSMVIVVKSLSHLRVGCLFALKKMPNNAVMTQSSTVLIVQADAQHNECNHSIVLCLFGHKQTWESHKI